MSEISREQAHELGRATMKPAEPAPINPAVALQTAVVAMVQDRLDAFARERGYDGILSATTYATDTHPPFALEGARCVQLRGATWSACYAILGAVQAGQRPMPTVAEVEAELPALTWA
jgi:hypothetical protein